MVLRYVDPTRPERPDKLRAAQEEEVERAKGVGNLHLFVMVHIGRLHTRRRAAAAVEKEEEIDGIAYVR